MTTVTTVTTTTTTALCIVPPSTENNVWELITRARTHFKDPGLFRWPPHINLLYPFLEWNVTATENSPSDIQTCAYSHPIALDPTISNRIISAVQRVAPFTMTLHTLGTFGNDKRGVLWTGPSSSTTTDSSLSCVSSSFSTHPYARCIHDLYGSLLQEFPECNPMLTHAGRLDKKAFHPHMTLSHFDSQHEAQMAQKELLASNWWPKQDHHRQQNRDNDNGNDSDNDNEGGIQFHVQEIYLLQRKGDDGQFMRVATFQLGPESNPHPSTEAVQIHVPPLRFPQMPMMEDEWVRHERMKLKMRRKKRPYKTRS